MVWITVKTCKLYKIIIKSMHDVMFLSAELKHMIIQCNIAEKYKAVAT